jgi:hypothetical protein
MLSALEAKCLTRRNDKTFQHIVMHVVDIITKHAVNGRYECEIAASVNDDFYRFKSELSERLVAEGYVVTTSRQSGMFIFEISWK